MKAVVSTNFDTKTSRILGYDPAYTTPWETLGTDSSSYVHLGLPVPTCVSHPRGAGQKHWVNQVVCYAADDDTGAFEPIPSVAEKGYYGERKVEKRPSAPTLPIVVVKPTHESSKSRAEAFKSLLLCLPELGKYSVEHAPSSVTADVFKRVLALISNLTVAPALPKDKWEARLDSLCTFEHGWDSDDAEPPSAQSIENARAFLTFLRATDQEPAALNPAVVGGVGFTFRHGKRSVYIEFRNTGNSHVAFLGAGKPRVEKVTQGAAGFRVVMHQAETHLYEQDAATAGSDEAKQPASD